MTILIDIGNSRVKYCRVNGVKQIAFSKITVVNNEHFNDSYFTEHFGKAKKLIIASVATDIITKALKSWCLNKKVLCLEIISERKKGHLISAYDSAQQLGVDRWLALLGTETLYPNKNVLLIDAGTATTIDLLTESGQHQGGWILAGVSTLFSSVLNETTKVNASFSKEANLSFGKNTTSNVNNACWAATIGLINEAVRQAEKQVKHLDEIIITGGNAEELQRLISFNIVRIDELIFHGLNQYR